MELWKEIEGSNSEVSNFGRIRNRHTLHINAQRLDKDGYARINLNFHGKYKTCQVHRLVVRAFLPNSNHYPQINHKDENKTNNRAENLEWCTGKYNTNYGTAQTRRVEAAKQNKLNIAV